MKWARLVMFGLALVAGGCEVSFFGGSPVTVISASGDSAGGTQARACGEPDDARRARQDAEACADRCVIRAASEEERAGAAGARFVTEGDCDAVTLGAPSEGVATLDLGSADGVVLTVEICDPEGTVMQLADSPSAAPGGGDAGDSAHDADVSLVDQALTVRASASTGVEPSTVQSFVPESGCHERTLVIADQIVFLVEPDAGLCGTGMLRIDPPVDAEGAPDARWYLALAGSVDGAAAGSGLRRASLCFW